MSPQRLWGIPGFENDQRVRPELGLEWADVRGVDVTGIFDAPFFPVHVGNVGAKGGQKLLAAARIGGDDGDYADHVSFSLVASGPRPAERN